MYEEDAVSHVHASVHEHSDLQGVILPAYHGKKKKKKKHKSVSTSHETPKGVQCVVEHFELITAVWCTLTG